MHTTPAFPTNVFVTPQREELQLTLRLSRVSPPQFGLDPPSDADDEARQCRPQSHRLPLQVTR